MDVQKRWETFYGPRLDTTPDDWCVDYSSFSRFYLYLSPLSAEGNPDPEKIGAFGVGE